MKLHNKLFLVNLIYLKEFSDFEKLKYVQPNHYNMQTTMRSKIIGMGLMLKKYPKYNKRILKANSKYLSRKKRIKVTLGTIKRVLKKTL